jgi:hypothetical protein
MIDPSRAAFPSELLAEIAARLRACFAASLHDDDVEELLVVEGRPVEALRRASRRERLEPEATALAALLDVLGGHVLLPEQPGAACGFVELVPAPGVELRVARLSDSGSDPRTVSDPPRPRLALRITLHRPAAAAEASVLALERQGVLPIGIGPELVTAMIDGAGVVVVGPARAARRAVVRAVATTIAEVVSLWSLTEHEPFPTAEAPGVDARARDAVALGADALVGVDLALEDAVALSRLAPAAPLLISVACPSADVLHAALARGGGGPLGATLAVVGFGMDGGARLVELHGPTRAAPVSGARPIARDDDDEALARPRVAPGGGHAEREPHDDKLPPLPPVPAAWASDDAEDEPGWELGSAGDDDPPRDPPAGKQGAAPTAPRGSFGAALLGKQRGALPAFTPRTPPSHPQAAHLQAGRLRSGADPFGGLTLEPPPGASEEGDAEDGMEPDDVDDGGDLPRGS